MASKTLPSLRLSDFCKFTERDSQAEWEFYGELYYGCIDGTLGEKTRATLFELGMEVGHMARRRASDSENKVQSTKGSTGRLWLASERRRKKKRKRGSDVFLSQDTETWVDPTEPHGAS